MSEIWTPSVDLLMGEFRVALLALFPTLERVRIWWREGESWDEWDRITDALYQSIVLDAVRESRIEGEFSFTFPQCAYSYREHEYSKMSLVAVQAPSLPPDAFFVRFATVDKPLDSVTCTTSELVKEEGFLTVPFSACRFGVLLRRDKDLSPPSGSSLPEYDPQRSLT